MNNKLSLKKIFSTVSIKEFLLIFYAKVLYRLGSTSTFNRHYFALAILIETFDKLGYDLSTYKNSLQVNGKNKYKGFKFLLRPLTSDEAVFNQVIVKEEYLPLINMINKKNQSSNIKTIIDAGANVGFTTIFLKRFFPEAKIVCIEPDNLNIAQLVNNLKINSLDSQVKPLNIALWHNDNDTLFIKNDFRDGNTWAKSVGINSSNSTGYKVKSITLKKLIEENDLDRIDLLKIDIEGAEVELFKDDIFVQCLSEKVKFLAIEIHDELGAREMIEGKLAAKQFEMYRIGETNFCFNRLL